MLVTSFGYSLPNLLVDKCILHLSVGGFATYRSLHTTL